MWHKRLTWVSLPLNSPPPLPFNRENRHLACSLHRLEACAPALFKGLGEGVLGKGAGVRRPLAPSPKSINYILSTKRARRAALSPWARAASTQGRPSKSELARIRRPSWGLRRPLRK